MRVVCIKDNWNWPPGEEPPLKPVKDGIYTVHHVERLNFRRSPYRDYYVLNEIAVGYWITTNFREVDDTFGERVAGRIEQEIEEEELQEA